MKGSIAMCREVEKIALEERNKGRAEGRVEAYARVIRNIMTKMSFSLEEAMLFMELSESEKDAVRKKIA